MYVQCVRENVVADNTICAQMETRTHTYTNSHIHMHNKQKSYFTKKISHAQKNAEPNEDERGSCVP